MKYRRIFLIVADSMGIGEEPDAHLYGDQGTNTIVHAASSIQGFSIPVMESLGIGSLADIPGVKNVQEHPSSFALTLREQSKGKDTMTGHWEMMGIETTKPFQTFTDTGFPASLIHELEGETGHKIIGNKAASGTEILKELGEEQMRENSLIVYTSADSVLQIAAHEEVTGLKELYRCCEIARKITMRPEYFVGRVIARPYIGKDKDHFKRTENRHDYTVSPPGKTALDFLKENGFMTSGIGKIADIFNNQGISKTIHTGNNRAGMEETRRQIVEDKNDSGLWFINLVDFDSEYGHRRNPQGYARCIEEFDQELKITLPLLKEDDLLMITADHGNDPTHHGTDHTREKVPLLIYSPSIKKGRKLEERASFSDIGATILDNFGLKKPKTLIGTSIKEVF